ncbi:hypothetical protein J6590_003955 [Homalodisca vitripennis]|nr:hypothetical protein J6590_003955 [Homalodisca vitripennis]
MMDRLDLLGNPASSGLDKQCITKTIVCQGSRSKPKERLTERSGVGSIVFGTGSWSLDINELEAIRLARFHVQPRSRLS